MLHVYFTGSAGNVTAGKYNDGAEAKRAMLADRVHAGWSTPTATPTSTPAARSFRWLTAPFIFQPREDFDLDRLKAIVADPKQTIVNRNRNAMTCGWLIRLAVERPIMLSRLDLGET